MTIQPQRRSNRIAMTDEERDAFLAGERTARVATVSTGGRPHVTPLWYVWDGEFAWFYSLTRSQRWADLARNPEVALVVDAGEAYGDLRGVELAGTAEFVGERPRTGEPNGELEAVERALSAKYHDGGPVPHDGRHAWVRVRPRRLFSWDFRKIGGA